MSKLMWKLREAVSNLIPLMIAGAIIYGGYTLYRQGTFRNGVGPAVTRVLHKIPYFGSRFKHYNGSGYAVAPRSRKSMRSSKRGKRHHGRRSYRRRH
jgi:hypothetical protein